MRELRDLGDYAGARVLARDDTGSFAVLLELARLEEELGDYDAAERAARLALDAAGDDGVSRARALARLSAALCAQRRLDDASAAASAAVEAAPPGDALSVAEAHVQAANVQLFRDAFADAEREVAAAGDPPPGLDGDRVRFDARFVTASVARGRGRYPEAERAFVELLADAEQRFGPEAIETGYALNGLGIVYKFWGRFDEGVPVYRRALAIVERACGELHPDVASIYHNLGGLEHSRRRFEEAEPLARRSVEIRRATVGPDTVACAQDEAAWASILAELGRDDEAEPLFRRAIDVLRGAFGPDHHEVGVNLNNLGALLERRGRLEEAEVAYREALASKERLHGADHPSIATTLNNLGVVRRKQGALDEARALYERAVAILERTVEPTHPSLTTSRRNLAKLAAREEAVAAGSPVVDRPRTEERIMDEQKQDEVEAHGINLPNTNENNAEDDDVEAHALGPLNVNESATEDDDVEGHGIALNVNEATAEDDDVELATRVGCMASPAHVMHLGIVPYADALALQRELAREVGAGERPDTVLFLEHPPVITLGRRAEEHELHVPPDAEVEIVETDRGGKSTYHAPGQLVCYPIFDLARHGQDVKRYCRDLEEALIRTLGPLGVDATRIDGLTGIWLEHPPRKIASIGIRLTKWISTHGYALNVDLDPAPFTQWITACGLEDAMFTTIARELGRPVSIDEVLPHAGRAFEDVFDLELQIREPALAVADVVRAR